MLPTKKSTRPPNWTKREIIDGILYQLKNGCNWEDLPKDLPPYSTVYWHYKQWPDAGVIEKLMNALHGKVRSSGKKKAQWTTLIIIDSQAVKNTCNAGVESKGFCFYKSTNGIKRYLAVDSLGFSFFTHCTRANLSDDRGLLEMLENNIDYFQSKPVNIPKIIIDADKSFLLDNGYHPDKLTIKLKKIYPAIMSKIKLELSPKPSKSQKRTARESTVSSAYKTEQAESRGNIRICTCQSSMGHRKV